MSVRTAVIDALFPESCLSCFLPQDITWRHEMLCDTCLFSPKIEVLYRCSVCRVPLRHPLELCHSARGTILSIATKKPNSIPGLIRGLSYQGIARAAYPLSTIMITGLIEAGVSLHKTGIVPLPTTTQETRERGYDHHSLVAERISSLLHIPLPTHVLSQERQNRHPHYNVSQKKLPTLQRLLIVSAAPLPHHTITALHQAFSKEKNAPHLFFVEPTP